MNMISSFRPWLLGITATSLFNAGIAEGRLPRYGFGDGGIDLLYQFDHANRVLEKEETKLNALMQRRRAVEQEIAKKKTDAARRDLQRELKSIDDKITAQNEIIEGVQKQVNRLATGRQEVTAGQLVARGIAGEDFYLFDYGTRVDSLWDGLKQGFILGTAKEFGDFVRTKMRGVFQEKLGVLFDSTVNSISDGFERIKEVLFHDSKRPFEENEVIAWQTHVSSVFTEIEKLAKEGAKNAYRSQDMAMRQAPVDFDVEGGLAGDEAAAVKPAIEPVRIWADLFGGYVLQLSYYILILQDRKGYYNADSFEVFFATHLEERLHQFCKLLNRINDLADLNTYLAENQAVIPAYKSNIDNLFKQLQQQVKTRTFNSNANAQQSIFDREKPATRKNRYTDYELDDYPQTGWAR